MHHYTLAWHDSEHVEHHICEYAEDTWQAAQHAREDVPYLQGHPLLRILLHAMCLLHTRRYDARHVDYRAKLVCNGA